MKHTQKIVEIHNRKYKNPLENTLIQVEKKIPMNETSKEGIISKENPLINIVTRTSNRPNGFKRCRESIVNQTYKNIRHIVSIDNLVDEYYVKDSGADYYFVDKSLVEKMPDIPDPKTGKRFIYNLYFNILFQKINDGWVLIIDDDDYLSSDTIIEELVKNISNNTDMIIFQMQYENGSLLPTIQEIGQVPRLGRIGSPCILVHSGIAKSIKWDGWKCGDFRYIAQCWKKTGNKIGFKKPVVRIGGQGFGMRIDLKSATIDLAEPIKTNSEVVDKPLSTNNKEINNDRVKHTGKLSVDIISVGWNCEKYLGDFFRSIEKQEVGDYNLKIHVLDDFSKDNTYNLLKKYANKNQDIIVYRNLRNMGAAFSRYRILKDIPEDHIAVIVDLDDYITPNAIKYISEIYNTDPNIHCTIGYMKNHSTNKSNQMFFSDEMIDSHNFSGKFNAPPLRTFRAKYFKNIPENLFKDENGEWYKYCTDVALMMGIIYQLSSKNVKKISAPLYVYRDNRGDGTLPKFGRRKVKTRDDIYRKLKGVFNEK